MKKSRPYNYSSKNRIQKTHNTKSLDKKTSSKDNKQEPKKTDSIKKKRTDIQSDQELLDTSFLENRIEKTKTKTKSKSKSKSKSKAKTKTDKEKKLAKENSFFRKIVLLKRMFLMIGVICLFAFLILLFYSQFQKYLHEQFSGIEKKWVKKESSCKYMDDNYLLVGDYFTKNLAMDFFQNDFHYVNISSDDMTTSKLLSNMKEYIYDYNPSIVFLELGYADLENNIDVNDLIKNYQSIIESIQSYRPCAYIVIESVYPNYHLDKTIEVNQSLKQLSKDYGLSYIDVYSFLSKKSNAYYEKNYSFREDDYQAVVDAIQVYVKSLS